jgi:hypothetical protein
MIRPGPACRRSARSATASRQCTPASRRAVRQSRRPARGMTQERAKALALKEAYRKLPVAEDGGVRAMPAIQAIMRSQILAAGRTYHGSVPAESPSIRPTSMRRASVRQNKAIARDGAHPPN